MENNLKAFINRSLDWLNANLHFFTLPSREEDEAEETIHIDSRRKAFGELILACMIMSRYTDIQAKPQFEKILNYVESQVRNPEYSFDMVRRINLFPFYLTNLIGLEACGKEFPEHRFAIQKVLDFGHMDVIERTAWNQIDMRYFLDYGGFKHRIADYPLLYRLSSIHTLAPVVRLRHIDVYALTHILFFIADFGRRKLKPVLSENFERMCEEIALLLGMYLYEKDWDLTGELLICCLCLNHRPFPLFDLAWEGLFEAQTPDGFIPVRKFDSEHNDLKDPEKAASYKFDGNYHSTLVGLIAAVLELHSAEL